MKSDCAMFLVVAIAGILAPMAAVADQEGPYTYTVTAGQATITDFNSAFSGSLSITNTLGTCPVTTIGDGAFEYCTNLTSVTIPDSVTAIEDYAFHKGISLTNVTIGVGVTNIGVQAFSHCFALSNVTIGGSVAAIGELAFELCTGLTGVTLPAAITSIGAGAFAGCTNFTAVVIPAGVTNIGFYAFHYCTQLTGITVVAANAFYTSVDGVLFDETETTLIQYPGGQSGTYAIPAGVTDIGAGAFSYCNSLTGVDIPDSVTSIQDRGFGFCTGLTTITIPASVISIEHEAFLDCTGLLRVYFAGDEPQSWGYSMFRGAENVTVYYQPDKLGWPWLQDFADRPVVLWNPIFTAIGPATGPISCTITGTPSIPIMLQAATSLTHAAWVPLGTTTLATGSCDFADPDSTNYPVRFYRVVGP
jgi:hypothetical protein